jgi:endonuclease YncB( thermonuclease family)
MRKSPLVRDDTFVNAMLQRYTQTVREMDNRHLNDPMVRFGHAMSRGNMARMRTEQAVANQEQVNKRNKVNIWGAQLQIASTKH